VPKKAGPKKHPKGIRMTKGSRWNLKAQKGASVNLQEPCSTRSYSAADESLSSASQPVEKA